MIGVFGIKSSLVRTVIRALMGVDVCCESIVDVEPRGLRLG